MDFLVGRVNRVLQVRWEFWVLQDWMGPTVSLVCPAPGVHLEKKADHCRDRKETRGIRASRDHQGLLSMSTLQKTCTLKENRVRRGLKESVEVKDCRVWTLSQGSKERKGLWDFLDPGDFLVAQVCSERRDLRGFWEVQVSQV